MSRFLIFLSVFTSILTIGYVYTGFRLMYGLEISGLSAWLFWILIFCLILVIPASYFFSQTIETEGLQSVLSYVSFTGLGFFTILFTLVLMKDLLSLLFTIISPLVLYFSPEWANQFSLWSQEGVGINFILTSITLILAGTLTFIGFFQAHKRLKTIFIEVPVQNLHPDLDGFKIVQISDVHIGPTIKGKFLSHVVERINHLEPDFVAITGDLVDGNVNILKHHLLPLGALKSKYGTFFVTGNHEYYSGVKAWIKEIQTLGIRVLLNENELLRHKGSVVALAGVTDLKAGSILPEHTTNPGKAIRGGENSDFKILLAHQPDSILEAASYGYDLQLSGHTHGGQYFPGNIVIYLAQKFVAGLHRYKDMWLYVSRGTGYWGPPLRIGAPSEITQIVLRKA
ncbi:metallophosphoesterase [Leptospira idonii]|uniref:Metallophosphoesterase n=1 Tax=Leptospira idonii TaxID=1193500 RepID=A0A4R9M4U7_9LEPT|nr:metallophosphoesterase [Leptospira idonii]TGN19758.1 metallophosphoesterase [Leptospira idonii]